MTGPHSTQHTPRGERATALHPADVSPSRVWVRHACVGYLDGLLLETNCVLCSHPSCQLLPPRGIVAPRVLAAMAASGSQKQAECASLDAIAEDNTVLHHKNTVSESFRPKLGTEAPVPGERCLAKSTGEAKTPTVTQSHSRRRARRRITQTPSNKSEQANTLNLAIREWNPGVFTKPSPNRGVDLTAASLPNLPTTLLQKAA